MQKILVQGGNALHGDVRISGAKNAVLPILCAALLSDDVLCVSNVPRLHDVKTTLRLLGELGAGIVISDDFDIRIDPRTVNLDVLAKQTPGFSGADLANLVNEAAILAARRNKKAISLLEFEEAIDRVIAGPERKSRIISEREKAITAYHESGHAVVGRFTPNSDPVHKVSIIARGMMGGYTRYLPTEDRYFYSKSQFEDMLARALAGHVAEEITFGEMTTGSSNDIERATATARKMVTEYGMSKRIGPLTLGHKDELVFLGRDIAESKNYSEKSAEAIDEEIRALIDAAYNRGKEILTTHNHVLEKLSQALIKLETIEGDELERVFAESEHEAELASAS
jgi:cell division protease FtsH